MGTTTTTILLLLLLFPLLSHAATFTILNRCLYTVWVAAIPGGSWKLDSGETWTFSASPVGTKGLIWGRTGCDNGGGQCQTGDCSGLFQCTALGSPPYTLVEYYISLSNNQDFYDMSLIKGFNVPMDFAPTSADCHNIRCSADIAGQCPGELKVAGGCNNPCTVFKNDTYCCTGSACGPTDYSRFFKNRCPDAYSYPMDDATSTFTCPTGTDYLVTFCPFQMNSLVIRIKPPHNATVTSSRFVV